MVDSVGFSAVASANTTLDPRGSANATAASAGDGGTAPVTTATKAATYFSPQLRFDQSTDQLLIQYRNPDTGEVERQYPSRQVVQQYEQAEQQRQAAEAQARLQSITTGHPVTVQVQTDLNGQPVAAKAVPVPQPSAPAVQSKPQLAQPAQPAPQAGSESRSAAPASGRGITA